MIDRGAEAEASYIVPIVCPRAASISSPAAAAALIENELKDLFGLKVTGLALDYEGRFLLSDGAPHAPQGKPIPQRTVVAYPPPQEKGA